METREVMELKRSFSSANTLNNHLQYTYQLLLNGNCYRSSKCDRNSSSYLQKELSHLHNLLVLKYILFYISVIYLKIYKKSFDSSIYFSYAKAYQSVCSEILNPQVIKLTNEPLLSIRSVQMGHLLVKIAYNNSNIKISSLYCNDLL